ncbi:hypothetical protein HMPREF9058_1478 [Actinomyces sp. oral taxon 175 str. F0384]|nr:hypothetical protein HMPREF9058_1478 [Actinomyces sp. oral taxon 175 str. F0384]
MSPRMSHRPPPQTIDGIKARQTHSHARINIATLLSPLNY